MCLVGLPAIGPGTYMVGDLLSKTIMNIFATSGDPYVAASHLGDPYLNKMNTESCQIMATIFPKEILETVLPPTKAGTPWKHTHYNHPCCRWVRKDLRHLCWLHLYTFSLCRMWREERNKVHSNTLFVHTIPKAAVITCRDYPEAWPYKEKKEQEVIDAFKDFPLWIKHNELKFATAIPRDTTCKWDPVYKEVDVHERYRMYMGFDKNPSWKGRTHYKEPTWHHKYRFKHQKYQNQIDHAARTTAL